MKWNIHDELGGFYYPYTDEEIQNYAENILHLKNNLKKLYNLDLCFCQFQPNILFIINW